MGTDPEQENLNKIEHIVIVVMENRSFDHMLGYLKLEGGRDDTLVMGYFNGANLPACDHLAREFAVCDRWFCSVDGATWPNRLYLVTGRADGKKVNKKIPLYSLPSFVRHLDAQNVSWRWYCHDIATLRITDDQYRIGSFSHFAYFDRRTLLSRQSFLDDAARVLTVSI